MNDFHTIGSPRQIVPRLLTLSAALLLAMAACRATAAPIPIAPIKRDTPVSFDKDVLPILRRSCLACHNATEASGNLVLESPALMTKGGATGPALVPGKGAESLLLQLASHQDGPVMPPDDNDVSAKPLTSQELGLLKLWIDQGAKGGALANVLSPNRWRPLPLGSHPIYTVAVSPDGQFAACGRANQIFIYHVATGQLITRLNDPELQQAGADSRPGTAHLDIVQSLAFNKQGDMLASGGFRTAKLWRYPRDVQRQSQAATAEVRAVAVRADRSMAALGSADGKIVLWPLGGELPQDPAAKPLALDGHTGEVRGLCFAAGGQLLVSASADKTIRVWDTNDGSLTGRIDGSAELNAVAALLLPADPAAPTENLVEHLATGGADNLVRLWRLPRQLPQPLSAAPAKAVTMANSRDGLLALADGDGQVRLLSAEGKLLHQWQAAKTPISCLAVLDGASEATDAPAAAAAPVDSVKRPSHLVALGTDDGLVQVWTLPIADEPASSDPAIEPAPAVKPAANTAAQVAAAAQAPSEPAVPQLTFELRGSLAAITAVDFRADGRQLASAASDGGVSIWTLAEDDPLLDVRKHSAGSADPATQPAEAKPAAAKPAASVERLLAAVSPDGKLLATTARHQGHPAVVVRDLETGLVRQTLLGHEATILSLAFSSDGTKLATGSADATARTWDVGAAKFPELSRFSGHAAAVTAVAFSADSKQVLSGAADNSLKLWQLADGELLMDFAGHAGPIVGVAMTPANQPISASSDKTIKFWNAANGQAARTQTETAAVTGFALRPDGAVLAAALADNTVKTYAVTGGAVQLTLSGHETPIHSLDYSGDGGRLVTAAKSAAIAWDTADGQLLQIIPAEAAFSSAAYGASAGQIVLVQSDEVTIHPLRLAGSPRGFASKGVTEVVWHPNGQLLLAGGLDGTVRGFNATTFAQAFSATHGAPVQSLAVSADGLRLASGDTAAVKLWNPANGAALQPPQITGLAGLQQVQFSSDGQRLVAGLATAGAAANQPAGEVRVIQLATPAAVTEHSIFTAAAVNAVASNGSEVFSLTSDGAVIRGELLSAGRAAGHTQAVTSLAPVPPQAGQPPQLISGSTDGTVRRWNALTGAALAQMNHGGPVTSVAARPDGQRWASTSANNTVKLWNAANNAQVAQLSGDLRAKALVAKLTQKKNDATVKVTATKTAAETAAKDVPVKTTAEQAALKALTDATKDVETKAAALTAASTKKAAAEKLAIEAAAAAQTAARAMDKANLLAAELTAKAADVAAKTARIKAAAAAAPQDPALAKAAADSDTAAKQADTAAKAAVAAKAAPTAAATKTAQAAAAAATAAIALNKPFTDAATALATSQTAQRGAKQSHEVAVRDLKQATDAVPITKQAQTDAEALLKSFETQLAAAVKAEAEAQQPLHAVAFSPDSRILATGGTLGIVHTWDADSGSAVGSQVGHAGPVMAVAFVGDNAILSGAADKSAVVWDLNPNWRLERTIGDIQDPALLIDRVAAVDFSHDGTLLATAGGVPSRSGEVKIWKVADGSLVQAIPDAHIDAATAVAFSPDDQHVASAAADKYVKKFEVATGKLATQFEGHTNYALGVSWRAGGKILASSGADGTIRIWNADTGDRIRIITGFTKQVSAVRFIGETQFAMVATGQAQVRKYNTDNGGVQTNYGGTLEFMFCVDATADPNNGVVVAGGYDGQLRIWRSSGAVLQTLGPPAPPAVATAEGGEAPDSATAAGSEP